MKAKCKLIQFSYFRTVQDCCKNTQNLVLSHEVYKAKVECKSSLLFANCGFCRTEQKRGISNKMSHIIKMAKKCVGICSLCQLNTINHTSVSESVPS